LEVSEATIVERIVHKDPDRFPVHTSFFVVYSHVTLIARRVFTSRVCNEKKVIEMESIRQVEPYRSVRERNLASAQIDRDRIMPRVKWS